MCQRKKILCQQGVDLFLYVLPAAIGIKEKRKMVSSHVTFFTWLSFIYQRREFGIREKNFEGNAFYYKLIFSPNED